LTFAAMQPRSISRDWFCSTEKTFLRRVGTPLCQAAMLVVPSA
jgi:hypothetical protein